MESPTRQPFDAQAEHHPAEADDVERKFAQVNAVHADMVHARCGELHCTEPKCALNMAAAPMRLDLAGLYVVPGRPPLPCSAIALDQEGVHLRLLVRPTVGAAVTAKFDSVGAITGKVLRVIDDVAVVELPCDLRRTLAEHLSFALKPNRDGDQRRHLRIKPRHGETRIRTTAARNIPAMIEDISLSGAQIQTEAALKIGETIVFQRLTQAKVVRALDGARYGVEFDHPFLPDELTWAIRL